MKNLILAQAYNYDFAQLAPFIVSLRQTNFDGDVVMFSNRLSEDTKSRLKDHGIRVQEFHYRGHEVRNSAYIVWPWLRWLRYCPIPFPIKKAILRPIVNIPWVRMILYYDFLAGNLGRYDNVMLTDVRDVVFQVDPFVPGVRPGIRAVLEDASMRIGTSTANIDWITDLFGPAVLAELADRPISCSGTIIGDAPSMLKYLRAFIETAFTVRSTRLNGGDQGIHNFLVYKRLGNLVTLLRNEESEMLTMGYMPRESPFPQDADGRLVDGQGRAYSVLHQYDRHPKTADALRRFLTPVP